MSSSLRTALLATAALLAVVALSSRFRADAGDETHLAGPASGTEVETAVFALG